jgi:glycosyltransferase involved in cell wall biosynthesis
MSAPKLHILLSTYNGEAYLEELLDSVLGQSYESIRVHIRDDGSTDSTVSILHRYQAKDKRISVELGSNIGVQASFFSLLESVADSTGYFAFCDQDDIWDAQKLEVAVNRIQASERPDSALYFSRLSCVDSRNRHLYDTPVPRNPGVFNALVENSAIGCTCVFGKRLLDEFLCADPTHMIMHDWWMYLCAASEGVLIYDEVPRIRYRQHDNTATPREPGFLRLKNRFRDRLSRLGSSDAGLESLRQANHFLATYPDCNSRLRATLEELNACHGILRFFRRLKLVLRTPLHRNNRLETVALKLVILFDLY